MASIQSYGLLLLLAGALVYAPRATAQLAADQDRFLGCILKGRAGNVKAPPETFSTYFNKVTPENSAKWGNVEVARDTFDWSALDEQYAFAKTRNVPFTLHTLFWSEKEPVWLGQLSPEEIRAEAEEWVAAVARRYPDVHSIDVVNEAPHGKSGSPAVVEAFGAGGASGYDHVTAMYRLARRYFPDAVFVLNDYDVLNRDHYPAYDSCATALLAAGVLDALGCQAHFLEETSAPLLQSRLDHLSAFTGLPIYITEFELAFAEDAAQLTKYQELFPVIWEHPAVAGVTLWGYEEGSLWRDDGYLLRADGTERPALRWLRDYLVEVSD